MPESADRPLVLATRGSPLALAQSETVAALCRAAFPRLRVELRIIKTTGDKLQRASLSAKTESLPKGLFTKELEVALLSGEADLAVHSLKDLPTDLPAGLELGATLKRADPRDVLVYRRENNARLPAAADSPTTTAMPEVPARRGFPPGFHLADLPAGAVVATSSTRRKEQVLVARPGLQVIEIRGNVGTRLRKLADGAGFDATLLAAAGLERLGFRLEPDGRLLGPAGKPGNEPAPSAVPEGLLAVPLPVEEMLPCVGQAAIGIETRTADERVGEVCARLNDPETFQCVTAERAFLHALGGGCLSPVAAHAERSGRSLRIRGVSFRSGPARRAELSGSPDQAHALGERLADQLR